MPPRRNHQREIGDVMLEDLQREIQQLQDRLTRLEQRKMEKQQGMQQKWGSHHTTAENSQDRSKFSRGQSSNRIPSVRDVSRVNNTSTKGTGNSITMARQCCRCQGFGHIASNCPNARVVTFVEEMEEEEEVETLAEESKHIHEIDILANTYSFKHQGSHISLLPLDVHSAEAVKGQISIYDLRMSDPIQIKDHMYGRPILNIKCLPTLNSKDPKLISADSNVVRVRDPNLGDKLIDIEPSDGTIKDICVFRESGLMLMALDCSQIPAYFIPNLGPAPKWCSYLENLTEEMGEGSQTTIYDDYQFLIMEDLEKLHLTNLVGTNLLRVYMYGFFIDYRLFKKAHAIVDPFAYETYIEKKKQEKIEAERASRITIKRKLPKVNHLLVTKLLENQEAEDEVTHLDDPNVKKISSKKKKGLKSEIFKDDRFTAMFENKDLEVEELVWIWLRKEGFPHGSISKLKPHTDDPFRIIGKLNENAYQIDFPGESNISATFNISDLSPRYEDETSPTPGE